MGRRHRVKVVKEGSMQAHTEGGRREAVHFRVCGKFSCSFLLPITDTRPNVLKYVKWTEHSLLELCLHQKRRGEAAVRLCGVGHDGNEAIRLSGDPISTR